MATTRIQGMVINLPFDPPITFVNDDEMTIHDRFFRIALNPLSGWYGVFATDLDDALETLGAWADDNAPGLIVDCTGEEFDEEHFNNHSYHFVNGALDCALDLNECMLVEEYEVSVQLAKV